MAEDDPRQVGALVTQDHCLLERHRPERAVGRDGQPRLQMGPGDRPQVELLERSDLVEARPDLTKQASPHPRTADAIGGLAPVELDELVELEAQGHLGEERVLVAAEADHEVDVQSFGEHLEIAEATGRPGPASTGHVDHRADAEASETGEGPLSCGERVVLTRGMRRHVLVHQRRAEGVRIDGTGRRHDPH